MACEVHCYSSLALPSAIGGAAVVPNIFHIDGAAVNAAAAKTVLKGQSPKKDGLPKRENTLFNLTTLRGVGALVEIV